MTQRSTTTDRNDEDEGLNWGRIAGFTMVVAFHAAAIMLLLAPVNPPNAAAQEEAATRVVICLLYTSPSPRDS